MAKKVREFMSKNPVTLKDSDSCTSAAKAMADSNIGDVLMLEDGGRVGGIVTDRDIVVRCLAQGKDPKSTKLSEVASKNLYALKPDDDVDEAIRTMADKKIRRVPIVDNGRPVGMVSLGDLAEERDPGSVLGQVSKAPPNT